MADGASLRSTAWILSGLSVWALSLADYASKGKAQEEDAVELGLFIVGACALMWAAPLAQLAGARLRSEDGFRLVQFFMGGLPSVLLQAFAWSCYATAVFSCIMYLLNPAVKLRGLKTALALLGLAAQVLVNVSVDLFEAVEEAPEQVTSQKRAPITVTEVLVSALAFALSAVGLAASLLADIGFFEEESKPTSWNVSMVCFTLSVFSLSIAQVARRRRSIKDSNGSVEESDVIQVARLFSWLLYGCTLWIYIRLFATPVYASLKGTTVALGIVGTLSSMLSMYALLWRPRASLESATTKTSTPHGANQSSIIYRISVILLLLSLLSRAQSNFWAYALSIIGAPLAHVGAWLVYRIDDGFKLARALQGGTSFSVFQGVGWMAYAFSVLGALVYGMSSDIDLEAWARPTWEDAYGFLHPMVFIAHISLLWSKQVFRRVTKGNAPVSTPRKPASGERDDSAEKVSSSDSSSPKRTIREGAASLSSFTSSVELFLNRIALVLITSSVLLQFSMPAHPQYSVGASVLAAVCLILTMPGPFSSAAPIVVQQALGWTLFGVTMVAQTVILLNVDAWFEYDMIATLVRAFGLIVLLLAEENAPSRPTTRTASEGDEDTLFSPRRRRRTDEEFGMDIRELDNFINQARRPAVISALNEARSHLLGAAKQREITSVILGMILIIAVHANLGLSAVVDSRRSEPGSWPMILLTVEALIWIAIAVCTHAWLGPMLWHNEGYKTYQPFHGGLHHVVLQAMGWTLLITSSIARLISFNYGLPRIGFNGLLAGIGLASYSGCIVLLASLARFNASAPHLGFAFDLDGRGLGWILSVGALLLLVGVDLAIVRFGLEDTKLLVPVIACAWIAVASSVPLAYILEQRTSDGEQQPRRSRFGILRVVALAIWTFSMFLTLFLIGRAALLTSGSWLSSKTGVVSIVAHGMMAISSDPAHSAFLAQQVVFLVFSLTFLYLIMPFVRGLLDWPMWYYAYYFKTWRHSLSPDGKHPMERTRILRNIHFGMEMMDVMVPTADAVAAAAEAEISSTTSEPDEAATQQRLTIGSDSEIADNDEPHPPVVYMHGGGHLFLKREVLAHSVTPLCRAGVVVYAVEYPLSPEARFPAAVVCVLQALSWIRKYHCKGGRCIASPDQPPRRCEACAKVEQEPKPHLSDFPCRCCPHRRGANVVQLCGDSAGGNLAAMVAAILCNPALLKTLAPISGHPDFADWPLPRVQRLGVIYGLLGRSLVYDEDARQREGPSWTEWLVKNGMENCVGFLLDQYSGGKLNKALGGKVVLNDLQGALEDFAPETLLICGTADPLLPTNRQALKLIRSETGRECRLVEYEGSFHAFHGVPIQWTFGRWLKDAYPATCELVKFFTGGKESVAEVDVASLPRDFSPLLVFPMTFLGIYIIFKYLWAGFDQLWIVTSSLVT